MPVRVSARYSCGNTSHRHRSSIERRIDARFNLLKQTEGGELCPPNHETD